MNRKAIALVAVLLSALSGCGSASTSGSHPGLFAIYDLTIDPRHPQTVYATSSDDPVYKSTDGGATWQRLEPTKQGWGVTGGVVLDPRRPDTLYVATEAGIFKSADGGSSWSRWALKGQYIDTLAIAPNGRRLYAAVASCTNSDPEGCTYSGPAVFKSTDGGAHWTAAGLAGQYNVEVAFDPRKPDTIYAGIEGGSGPCCSGPILKSTDGGSNWHKLHGIRWEASGPFVDPYHPKTVYATNAGGVFRSTDEGSVWRRLGGWDVHPERKADNVASSVGGLAFGPNAAYAATGDGVFRRTTAGTDWRLVAARGRNLDTVAVSANGRVLYAGSDNGAVYRFRLGGRP